MQRPDSSDSSASQPPEKLHLWQIQAVRDVLFIAAVVALFWLGYALRAVTVPLLVALLLAYLFEPVVSYLVQRTRYSRAMIVSGLLCSVGLAVAVILFLVSMAVVGQSTVLINDIRAGRFQEQAAAVWNWMPQEYRDLYEDLQHSVVGGSDEEPPAAGETDDPVESGQPEDAELDVAPVLDEAGEPIDIRDELWIRELVREETQLAMAASAEPSSESTAWIQKWMDVLTGGADAIGRAITMIIGIGFLAFLIPFYFFFFSTAYPSITDFGRSLIPEANRERALELLAKMDRVIAGFVRGRIIVSLLMGVMFAAGWWIVGVPYALVLGLIIGLFCAVPFLGVIGVPIAVGLLLFDQINPDGGLDMPLWAILVWPTAVFALVQTIESYLLTPAIAGKATNLDPVTIIVAVIAGGSIMGIYGMLLAIPLAACLKILITDVLLPKIRAWTRGEAADPLPID